MTCEESALTSWLLSRNGTEPAVRREISCVPVECLITTRLTIMKYGGAGALERTDATLMLHKVRK